MRIADHQMVKCGPNNADLVRVLPMIGHRDCRIYTGKMRTENCGLYNQLYVLYSHCSYKLFPTVSSKSYFHLREQFFCIFSSVHFFKACYQKHALVHYTGLQQFNLVVVIL